MPSFVNLAEDVLIEILSYLVYEMPTLYVLAPLCRRFGVLTRRFIFCHIGGIVTGEKEGCLQRSLDEQQELKSMV
ncbi:hypothetical protein K469DRAFT_289275 [Zopfia rhizophila CBS 207.26]|uniref:F-box domain-containing protein n=1 Tax=Zopfia rhizophila CBS 207.26 TaxID=1314779 RepID=A0A6A6ER94_9PEZI|nr:hypothetical protein K469DRAFT_289275 [Zopfia rhizophila CBS 207.26]